MVTLCLKQQEQQYKTTDLMGNNKIFTTNIDF